MMHDQLRGELNVVITEEPDLLVQGPEAQMGVVDAGQTSGWRSQPVLFCARLRS
jgi:hypothetical protein